MVKYIDLREWLNGRAVASQAEGCGFDSRFPLHIYRGVAQLVARMVRDHEAASSSLAASTNTKTVVRRFFVLGKRHSDESIADVYSIPDNYGKKLLCRLTFDLFGVQFASRLGLVPKGRRDSAAFSPLRPKRKPPLRCINRDKIVQ